MEPLMYIMAILGCGESEAPCREIAVVETRYATEADCVAATGTELIRREQLPYPTVVAQCRRAGTAAQPLRGEDVLLPEPDPRRNSPRFADTQDPRTES